MGFPSDKYKLVNEDFAEWLGPCSDSFCYASCTSPSCHPDNRLGKTPKEHNVALRAMQAKELEEARELVRKADAPKPEPVVVTPYIFAEWADGSWLSSLDPLFASAYKRMYAKLGPPTVLENRTKPYEA